VKLVTAAGLIALAAGIAAFTGIGAGLSIGMAAGKAAESVARQPEASGKIQSVTLLIVAFAEATAIYGFILAIIILLVYKPV
jgi:F-type H+-transporting ATPase subunit c